MAITRPYALNSGSTITGANQVGDISYGEPNNWNDNNVQWYNGPDESLGYIIASVYKPLLKTSGLVFFWDGMYSNCWDGLSSTHYELRYSGEGIKNGINTLTRSNDHVSWTSNATSQSCYLEFDSSNITVPTGDSGTWLWSSYFIDAGSLDHPNFGKEDSNGWNGVNGFVFGTGWGTDGPRWGIGGTAYTVYDSDTCDYRTNVWQIYCVTYTRNSSTGLKTYLLDSNGMRLAESRTSSDSAIGSNTEPLRIGCTNYRGGNWNGYMDNVYMWNRELSSTEVYNVFRSIKNKFSL